MTANLWSTWKSCSPKSTMDIFEGRAGNSQEGPCLFSDTDGAYALLERGIDVGQQDYRTKVT